MLDLPTILSPIKFLPLCLLKREKENNRKRFTEANDHTTSPSLEYWAGSSNFGIFFKLLLSASGIANLKPHKRIWTKQTKSQVKQQSSQGIEI